MPSTAPARGVASFSRRLGRVSCTQSPTEESPLLLAVNGYRPAGARVVVALFRAVLPLEVSRLLGASHAVTRAYSPFRYARSSLRAAACSAARRPRCTGPPIYDPLPVRSWRGTST